MARRNNKTHVATSGGGGPLTDSPFARLAGLRDQLPEHESEPPADESEPPADIACPEQPASVNATPPGPQRAVVRFQRKGRGGKEVTLVEQLDLAPDHLDSWLAALKRSLGCGGAREGDVLVLQGDQRQRLPGLLRQRGVDRVSCS